MAVGKLTTGRLNWLSKAPPRDWVKECVARNDAWPLIVYGILCFALGAMVWAALGFIAGMK